MTFVHFTIYPASIVILSGAKNLPLRPFASLRVTLECANLVWFDLVLTLLQRVSLERLHKAVEGLLTSAYTVTVTTHTEAELRGSPETDFGSRYGKRETHS